MRVGAIIPQGWLGEFNGLTADDAWQSMSRIATQADSLGFESIWLFDHPQAHADSPNAFTFEAFASLSALAAMTTNVRLGHLVLSAGFRSPALTAKAISTMDVISRGRIDLGIGAGWKEDEWRAYGFGYPSIRERLDMLEDSLEIITRMMSPGPATYRGRHASVENAINEPATISGSHVPIIVGGNGRRVTWRLAARFADEVNLDGLTPSEVIAAMPELHRHCAEVGRDPATLRVSVHILPWDIDASGAQRQRLLSEYLQAGVSRVMAMDRASIHDEGALERLRFDAQAIGAEFS